MNPAPMPAITALYAGLIALLLIVIAIPVSRLRRDLKVGLGDGGDRRLLRAIRVHANAVEWAGPALLLLLVAELTRAAPLFLHACGIALVAGRLLHAIGLSMTSGASFGRFVGTGLTWASLIALALWGLWAFARTAIV
jgi:uncharacterized membrane protein YecN with MAPEG domain